MPCALCLQLVCLTHVEDVCRLISTALGHPNAVNQVGLQSGANVSLESVSVWFGFTSGAFGIGYVSSRLVRSNYDSSNAPTSSEGVTSISSCVTRHGINRTDMRITKYQRRISRDCKNTNDISCIVFANDKS